MEYLQQFGIKDKLVCDHKCFDLTKCNKNTIILLEEEPEKHVEELFNSLVTNDKIKIGYYYLRNLFQCAQTIDHNLILNLIIKSINQKISIIKNCIVDENGNLDQDFSLGMYLQIWKSYKEFCSKMYFLLRHYQKYLTDKNIIVDKLHYDVVTVLQMCLFYDNIIKQASENMLAFSSNMDHIDYKNIDQLIDYIDSIRAFILMKNFTTVNVEQLTTIIKNFIGSTNIINLICWYLNDLMINLNKRRDKSVEYETMEIDGSEKLNIKKIYKVTSILCMYGNKIYVLPCYQKFMQSRIINLEYNQLEIEIELINRMLKLFGKQDCEKLANAVSDIINNKNINQIIQNRNAKIVSTEYQGLQINTGIVNAIVLTKKAWLIYNILEMEVNYPAEMKCYLDIISKYHTKICHDKCIVNWQPSLGYCQFEAQYGHRKIYITCNTLQAMALMFFNNCSATTIKNFSDQLFIDKNLGEKILQSLTEVNLLVALSENNNLVYKINTKNYTGESVIDIRETFVELFDEESESEKMTSGNHKPPMRTQLNQPNNTSQSNNQAQKLNAPTKTFQNYLEFYNHKMKELESDKDMTTAQKKILILNQWEKIKRGSVLSDDDSDSDN